ncbi:MAG: hypothetical protein ACTHJM_16145 [Marmoricola sp.]
MSIKTHRATQALCILIDLAVLVISIWNVAGESEWGWRLFWGIGIALVTIILAEDVHDFHDTDFGWMEVEE